MDMINVWLRSHLFSVPVLDLHIVAVDARNSPRLPLLVLLRIDLDVGVQLYPL